MQTIKKHKYIILIIFLAAFLRLYGLSRGDTMNDESLMAFRAIGMIDFDEAAWQTTPFEWFDPLVKFSPTVPEAYRIGTGIPWWAHLSWHDHPPLVFLVQHIFMSIFGEHTWAFRLPSALLGVISVYLIYLIGNKIYSNFSFVRSENKDKSPPPYEGGGIKGGGRSDLVGLFSALIYAVTLNGVYISRTGMQEPYVIFFILLVLYLFLLALDDTAKSGKYFLMVGALLGVGTLAKYTTFFVTAPIIFIYILLFRRDIFRKKQFWVGIILFFVFISPSIIYNIELYKAVGHFDFQLSTIFGQTHPAWQVQPGKDIGSIADRIKVFVPRMISTNSWVFLGLFAMSILGFLVSVFRNGMVAIKKHSFLLVSLFCVTALLLAIGPSFRFLTMLMPFISLCSGILLSAIQEHNVFSNPCAARRREQEKFFSKKIFVVRKGIVFLIALLPFVLFEIFYSWNNQIAYYPIGPAPWVSSKVRYENYNWGYNELNDYFENEFKNKIPALTFDLRYQFLNDIRDKALAGGIQRGYIQYPAIIIYDGIFDQVGKMWSIDRFHIYHAWPMISLAEYNSYLQKNGDDFFAKSGFTNYYFITPSGVISQEFSKIKQGASLEEIKNPRGEAAVFVYKK